MDQRFERIDRHLYRRQYLTAGGVKTTLYYARFKEWRGKHRTIPLGSVLRTAREQLTVLEAQNIRHEDFDVDRQPALEQERLTISKYIPRFLETKQGLASYESYKVYCSHLGRILGPLPLDEITRTKIAEYKQIRRTEPIQRHEKPVEGTLVKDSTVNRDITTLIGLLNLAAEDGVLDRIPATRRLKEPEDP